MSTGGDATPAAGREAGAGARSTRPSARPAVRGAVVALVVLQALVAASYAVAMPTWRAPDEPSHFDLVWVAREGAPWPLEAGDRRLHRRIEASYAPARFDLAARHDEPPLAQADAVPRPQRPAFAELADDVADGAGNGMFQHPPGYYAVTAVVTSATLTLTPGADGWSYDQVVLAARLVGALAVAAMPWLAFAAARRLGAAVPAALAAAVVPVAVPQLAHVAGAVNNDALLALAVGGLTVTALRLAAGDLRARVGAGVGAIAAAGLLTKGFALFAPALVAPAAVLGGWRAHAAGQPAPAWRAAGAAALAGGIALAVGGWWWLRNLAVHGTVQPSGIADFAPPAGFEPSLPAWLAEAAVQLPSSFWGQFGWRQADLPTLAVVAAAGVLVAGIAVTMARGPAARPGRQLEGPGRFGSRRWDAALALLPTVAIAGIVLAGAWRYHVDTGLTPALQGRYLLGGLVGLAAVAAAGWGRLTGADPGRWAGPDGGPWLPLTALAGAVALHATAGWTILARFYGPADGATVADRLAALAAWAPLPRPALALLAVAVLAAAAVSGWQIVVATIPPRPARTARPRPTR